MLTQWSGRHAFTVLVLKRSNPDREGRAVVQRMAETGLTRFPVVDRDPPNRVVGIISLDDLLKARALNLEAERRRERIMRMDLSFPFKFRRARETV